MIITNNKLNSKPCYPFELDYELERIAFFDIETTGLSAHSSYLYLIGCAYYQDSSYYLTQWFSEDIKEETQLIQTFFEFLQPYQVLIHYNGSSFDIPYLKHKCELLQLEYRLDHLISLDLYKKILPYKKLLKLKSLKLTALELFLNIHRKDTYDGKDLIDVYQSYLGKKRIEAFRKMRHASEDSDLPSQADELFQVLLLHNKEDITGLFLISPMLSYIDLFEKPFRIIEAYIEQDQLIIRFEISIRLPVPLHCIGALATLTAKDNTAMLSIPVYRGECKYFYTDYKDYYYLPAEDYAVHKSVAQFVDKHYRIKAKPTNCYIKKEGLFVPMYEPVISPSFKLNYQDNMFFAEVHTDFLLQEENLERYVSQMLSHIR